ncbi:MAG: hypothetical protein AUK24_02195 [Syntrophaceae bacterium CG2_30_49_12]|nr:MAG: hypothetical protein AUK24_02195 [Syntrophaceae bacterium CG2_30_49_12]PIP06656.1 MAG: hypothetical protein COX52_06565 [Syntrophobacterales bacterium CG23_combo_of_CG06-09_8_20_14_all_48_27]PJC74973.1 MAG: hypothetical protein CO012_04590 [Syntrophobacterales bacterium CG_4_8_14_3_um_filter_49_14]
MAVVIISSADEQTRRELAKNLARKLGCESMSREQILDAATDTGIAVGKLEVAVLKRLAPRERLARDKARYLAFVTESVCERASKGDLVYHGRNCHLLLQGISHVIRVCVVPEPERRINNVMARLRLDRDKAIEYISNLDSDLDNWSHFIHGVGLTDPQHFDLVFNLQNISIESAGAALCSMAQLSDFQTTPASIRAMKNLWLAAKVRHKLGTHELTAGADLRVSAQDGRVTISYMPGQSKIAAAIPDVVGVIDGAQEIVCTMATTNILWIAESFDPSSSLFTEVADLAGRWGAAVELLRWFTPQEGEIEGGETWLAVGSSPGISPSAHPVPKAMDPTGGIEDDTEESEDVPDNGLAATAERLIAAGRFGGAGMVAGQMETIVTALKSDHRYSLVVIGEMFLSRTALLRTRLTRDITSFLKEKVNIPVIIGDELQERFLPGKRHLLRIAASLLGTAIIFGLVFTHQEQVLDFLAGPAWINWRILAVLGIAIVVPLAAYLYGGATGLILKLMKFE